MISPSNETNGGRFLLFKWLFFQMYNNINEIVTSGLVILLFIPPLLIGLLYLCIQ